MRPAGIPAAIAVSPALTLWRLPAIRICAECARASEHAANTAALETYDCAWTGARHNSNDTSLEAMPPLPTCS